MSDKIRLFPLILEGRHSEFQESIKNVLDVLKEQTINNLKGSSILLNKYEGNTDLILEKVRFRIVRARIRDGKIQRRKKLSNIKGFEFKGRRFVKIPPRELLNRRRGARRAKFKRKAKRAQINRNLHRSLRRRRSIGL